MNLNDFPEPYIPTKLPNKNVQHALMNDSVFLSTIIQRGRKLSEFIGYLQNLPNPEILITSLTLQEAVLSSRIEGTVATVEDVVNDQPSSDIIKDDIIEIENYQNAIQYGYEMLSNTDRGISKGLIKELHKLLLENNVRGATKTPGEFKTEQNYILNNIIGNFTPLPPLLTDDYIDNLVDYIKSSSEFSELVQAATMHAQFEMIHPFKDGNGRVGRLLIPLLLFYKKVIPYPIFYISRFFAMNDDQYKALLANISKAVSEDEKNDAWKQWILFFFDGIATESEKHIKISKKIIDLRKEMISQVKLTGMIALIDCLFHELRIEPKEAIPKLQLPHTSSYKELRDLAEKGYITRKGSSRKTIYIFSKLVDIIQ